MPINKLLNRLDRVKQTGHDRWMASCPTREDKHPSLAIKLLPDGRILLYDFGGDSIEDILDAIGMSFSDLFPEQYGHHMPPERRPFPATDVLRAIVHEALVVCIVASTITSGKPVTSKDLVRVELASSRIRSGLEAAGANK